MKSLVNKYIICGMSLCSAMFFSCDDFLDVAPTSELESVYFENEDRVNRGIGAIYSEIGVLYCPNMGSGAFGDAGPLHKLWMLPGDDITVNNNSNSDFEAFVALTTSNGVIKNYWNVLYATIARANFMLEKLEDPNVLSVIKTENLADYCKGEALFLRSYANYCLWDYFRKAPNHNFRIKTIEDAILPPTKGFELLDQAIDDLKTAEGLLPESWDDKNKGRVFKNSARGLLVKCYLLRACYADKYNGNSQEDYNNAIEWFEKISDVSSIDNVPFGDNFDYRTENNAESLYEYQASHNIKEDNPWLNGNFGGDAGAMGATYIYQWSHQHTDYMFGGRFGPTKKLVDAFDINDPRYSETIFQTNTKTDDDPSWFGDNKWTVFNGYQFIKYINGDRRGDLDVKYGVTSCNNPRILRLADIKLGVAEAYLQTGNTGAALKQVNDVRKRARMSALDGIEASEPADLVSVTMDDIIDERLRELAGEEGIRFSDMKRWHAAGYIDLSEWADLSEVEWGYDASTKDVPFGFDINTHLLYPIPMAEISSNPLLQADGNNPGYN